MFTATANLILPSTTTGSFPRPRWYDVSMWGRRLDTCMQDVRFREKFQDALAVVISDQERAGLDIASHGDFHVDEDLAGRAWHHYPLQRWAGFEEITSNRGDHGTVATLSAGHAAERNLHRVGVGRTSSTKSNIAPWTTLRCGASRRERRGSLSSSEPVAHK